MSREAPVRFWEGLGVKFPRATQLPISAISVVKLKADSGESQDSLLKHTRPRLRSGLIQRMVVGT